MTLQLQLGDGGLGSEESLEQAARGGAGYFPVCPDTALKLRDRNTMNITATMFDQGHGIRELSHNPGAPEVLLSCHLIPGLPWALVSEGCPGLVTAEQGPSSHVSKDSSRLVLRAWLTSLSPRPRGVVGGLSVVATGAQQCGW